MKRNVQLFLLLVIFASSCQRVTNSKEDKAPIETMQPSTVTPKQPMTITSVDDIQKAYGQVAAQMDSKTLDTTSFNYNCNGETSGSVTYYTSNGELKLIRHGYNEYDHYEAEDLYFVNHDELFFVHSKNTVWSFDSGPEGATKDRVTEQRIYLLGQKPVKCLEKKYEIRKHLGINTDPQTIPNKTKACAELKLPLAAFKQLKSYWKGNPPKCIEIVK